MINQDNLLKISAATLPALHRALATELDPATAARLARQFGFESGQAFHNALDDWSMRETGQRLEELDADGFWDTVSAFFSLLGWGELRHEQLHPGIASVESRDWVEAQPHLDTQHPTCHVTTGLLADLLSRVAGTDLAVMEAECRSTGADSCRFLIGGPAALESVYTSFREGSDLSGSLARL